MASRRNFLSGMLGLSAGLVGVPSLTRASDNWVSHDAAVDGGADSYFSFGTLNGAPQIWAAHNAGHPYCCRLSPDGRLLRLELRAGDQWPDEARLAIKDERSLVQAMTGVGSHVSQALPMASDIWWAFSFLVEPGPPVSSLGPGYGWLILADIHSDFKASHARAVPIQFELDAGDIFTVQAHGSNLHPDNAPSVIYATPQPFGRGRWHDLVVRLNMDPQATGGQGGADVFLDGERIVAYAGPLGFVGDLPYPQFQIYRGNPSPQTLTHESLAVRYANHEIVTRGSLAARVRRPANRPANGRVE
ncbi:MAG TPA: heparin lyase I family protein [Rhizomicrobium sp.]